MLQALARVMYRRRRRVLVGWFLLLFLVFSLASGVGGAFRTDFDLPGSESQAAIDLLERSGFGDRGGQQGQIVFTSTPGVDDPAVQEEIEPLPRSRSIDGVARRQVVSPYRPRARARSPRAATIAYAEVNLADRSEEAFAGRGRTRSRRSPRTSRSRAGASSSAATCSSTEMEQGTSEAIGLLAAIIILLVAFGSVLAMGLPIAHRALRHRHRRRHRAARANVLDMPDFTMAAVAMIGIGVGIDYALFIVTRYRENLAAAASSRSAAVVRARSTPRAAPCLFAGTTVIISLLGLLLMTTSTRAASPIAISIGVLTTMLASVTLLPALLGFVGPQHRQARRCPTASDRDERPARRRSGTGGAA